jgi:hypothetical protein
MGLPVTSPCPETGLLLYATRADSSIETGAPVAKASSSTRASKANSLEYRFEIDAFTPESLPMARLAEYMTDLAVVLGEREHVHFKGVEAGSAVLVVRTDWEAYPKVRARVQAVKQRQAAADVLRAADTLNGKLAADNATAVLRDPQRARVLSFVGRDKPTDPEFVFTQAEELYGTVVVVGGTGDPVPVHVQDGAEIHLCLARRSLARELAHHIFGPTLLVSGAARRARTPDGEWKVRSFHIQHFRLIDDKPLIDVVQRLRAVDAAWLKRADPLSDLEALRKGS